METLTYTVTNMVTNSILVVNIMGGNSIAHSYQINNEQGRLVMQGCIEGKVKTTCLYVGNLTTGKFTFQMDEADLVYFSIHQGSSIT